MIDLTFNRSAEPFTPETLTALETEYEFTLPADYKQLLAAHNGGYPSRDVFSTPEGRKFSVNKFYPAGGGKGSLERSLELLSDQLHPDLVPIASEGGDDQFCLSVGPEDYGSVYYVSHESYRPPAFLEDEELEPQPRQYGKGVYFLAPSFTAFLDGLVDGPPVE